MAQTNISGNSTIVVHLEDGRLINYPSTVVGSTGAYVESKDLDLGSPTKDKYVDHIILDFDAPQIVPLFTVALGYRDALDEPILWLPEYQITGMNPRLDPRVTAKFFTLRFEDTLPVVQWRLSRIEFYGQVMQGRLA